MKYPQAILSFGENLDRLRKERGLSYLKLADEAELTKSHVIDIIKGRKAITIDTVFALAIALKVHPKELFDFN